MVYVCLISVNDQYKITRTCKQSNLRNRYPHSKLHYSCIVDDPKAFEICVLNQFRIVFKHENDWFTGDYQRMINILNSNVAYLGGFVFPYEQLGSLFKQLFVLQEKLNNESDQTALKEMNEILLKTRQLFDSVPAESGSKTPIKNTKVDIVYKKNKKNKQQHKNDRL